MADSNIIKCECKNEQLPYHVYFDSNNELSTVHHLIKVIERQVCLWFVTWLYAFQTYLSK